MIKLPDQEQRVSALTELDKSLIIEAGAGSGKTSLLAGRVVGLMANGIKPENIVSVSFTELAAAELLGRIHEFATKIAAGHVPIDIAAAYPDGLTPEQTDNLNSGLENLGDMTCTTIHGFCQKMLRPYPVESGFDPGANILDPNEASMAFDDILDQWIRKRLSGTNSDLDIITSAVSSDPSSAVSQIKLIANKLRNDPTSTVEEALFDSDIFESFFEAIEKFNTWSKEQNDTPVQHDDFVNAWAQTANEVKALINDKQHSTIINLLNAKADERIQLKSGGIKKYKLKGAWDKIDKVNSKMLNEKACDLHSSCGEELNFILEKIASIGLHQMTIAVKEVLEDFAEYKRRGAFLDFDDLLHGTHELLKNNSDVLHSLRKTFTHILVDEFQDTDPIQTSIFEMLSFNTADDGSKTPVPGGIFFVGDPKQSIYRFRGADVGTYVKMREQLRKADPQSVKSIFVNFRSSTGIIDFVNRTFEKPMSSASQPGFTDLSTMRENTINPAVMRYEVDNESNADDRRKFEANIVAQSIAHIIDSYKIPNKDGTERKCRASDIALLAPVNTSLFWLENALEELNIPVSTQAGKGLFQQQEVKDMIALTRVLGDHRDTIALGALLRGSFFGFTDRELLDVCNDLPKQENERLAFLNLSTNVDDINNPEISNVISVLSELRNWASQTTPFTVLTIATNYFNLRAKTQNRDKSNAARRLANIERYLEMSKAYDVRGISSFSDAMRAKWEDDERIQEGRSAGAVDAVSIITMHSSKGLEWPIVFMVNCSTEMNNRQTVFSDVKENTFTMKFLGRKPTGFDEYVSNSRQADEDERIRLMYVGLTRARDLLVLPDLPKAEKVKAWSDLVEIDLNELQYLSTPTPRTTFKPVLENGGTLSKEGYLEACARIEENKTIINKITPSRHEDHSILYENTSLGDILDASPNMNPFANVEGGAHRGNVLHKIMEELINGEIDHNDGSISSRASELIEQIKARHEDEVPEIHAQDILDCVNRTLQIPQVNKSWNSLVPEIGISSSTMIDGHESLTMGVIDAAEIHNNQCQTIFDWKSDLRPHPAQIDGYKKQMKNYLKATGSQNGLIVFMSTGDVIEVSP